MEVGTRTTEVDMDEWLQVLANLQLLLLRDVCLFSHVKKSIGRDNTGVKDHN